jgi:hypothetical protein
MREIIMTGDELDDGSLTVNFDLQDDTGICNTGGYVMVRQEDVAFVITCFDGQGNIVNEYVMDYNEAFNGE